MHFIHQSALVSHGHLRSRCCLVDSRWQIKITSFGLRAFKVGEKPLDIVDEESELRRFLYTAPELLRLSEVERPIYGSQKGDVYSFAIVVQEILWRTMDNFLGDLSAKGTLFR